MAWPCEPGLAPAGDSLFFASPNKSKQKKGEPGVWAPSLRCSALPQRRGEEQPDIQAVGYEPALMGQLEDPHPNPLPKGRGGNSRNPAACGTRFSPPAVMRRRVAQIWADQGWRCLSEASLARPRPNRATQRARSAAQGRRIRLAFSLPTFFWRSKRQVGRPPGRDPAPTLNKPNDIKK